MPLTINNINLDLDGIVDIIVSDPVPDPDSDYYMRTVSYFTETTGNNPNRQPLCTTTLRGGSQQNNDKSGVLFTTPPALTF